jgi:hypothetical protein
MNTKTRVHIYFNEEFELLHKYFIANDSYEFLPFESINKVDPNDFYNSRFTFEGTITYVLRI